MNNDKKISILSDMIISNLKKLPEQEQRLFVVQLFVKLKTSGFEKILEELK